MLTIKVKYNEDPRRAISKLKQLVSKEGLMSDLKKRQYYVKPSIKKRLKRENAEKQRMKDLKKEIDLIIRAENQMWE